MALSLLFCGIVSLFVTSAWGGSSDVQVGFVMMQHLEHGQEFRIVGSGRELGDWIISKGLPMTYHEGNLWTASVEVEIEDVNGVNDFEFKVVVVDGYYGGKAVCSMPGPNRFMNIPRNFGSKHVYFVHTIWDINTCPSSCSAIAACANTTNTVNTV